MPSIEEYMRDYEAHLLQPKKRLEGEFDTLHSGTTSSINVQLQYLCKKVEQWLVTVGNNVAWDSIIGNDKAKTALREAVEYPLAYKDLYSFYSITGGKGVLLSGPPGCGKTMLAKAVASFLSARAGKEMEMMLLPASALESKFFGETEQHIRNVFKYAREYKKEHKMPLVIFMDECESFLGARYGSWCDGQVNTFLDELDGLRENGAFIILATNQPDLLDQALLRDGRIDRKIEVKRPTFDEAVALARASMKPGLDKGWLKVESTAFIDYLFDPTHILTPLTNPESGAVHMFTLGHIVSGAMVVGLIERAKLLAFERDRQACVMGTGVTEADLLLAVDQLFEENKHLNHTYALREFIKDVALPAEAAREALRGYN